MVANSGFCLFFLAKALLFSSSHRLAGRLPMVKKLPQRPRRPLVFEGQPFQGSWHSPHGGLPTCRRGSSGHPTHLESHFLGSCRDGVCVGPSRRAGAGSLQGQNIQGGIPFILASFLRRGQECPPPARVKGPMFPKATSLG